jgi:hypothetical protein
MCDWHRQNPKSRADEIHLDQPARRDGRALDGKREMCADCRHDANDRALLELDDRHAPRRAEPPLVQSRSWDV